MGDLLDRSNTFFSALPARLRARRRLVALLSVLVTLVLSWGAERLEVDMAMDGRRCFPGVLFRAESEADTDVGADGAEGSGGEGAAEASEEQPTDTTEPAPTTTTSARLGSRAVTVARPRAGCVADTEAR